MMTKLAIAAAVILSSVGNLNAQTYPARPITMLVGYAVGGPSDTIARIMAERMKVALGQPVIVENVTGAAGSLAVGRAARAAPDGYTLGMGDWSTHVVNPAMYDLQYDVVKDFEPVSRLPSAPQIIVTPNSVPATNLKELIAWIKANQDKVAMGVGSMTHRVTGVYFQNLTGTRFTLVPYRGGAPAMQDLVSGQVDIMFDQGANALGQVKNGAIKAYAVLTKDRWPALPDVPSIDEAGVPSLYVSYWHGLWAPKGTPKEIIARLNAAVVSALADTTVRARLAEIGQEVWPREQQTPDALAAFHRVETEKWWPIIRASNLKAE